MRALLIGLFLTSTVVDASAETFQSWFDRQPPEIQAAARAYANQPRSAKARKLAKAIPAPARTVTAVVAAPVSPPATPLAAEPTGPAPKAQTDAPKTFQETFHLPIPPAYSIFVRHDFSDLGSITLPTPTKGAQGAEISYSRDYVAKNSLFDTQGLIGVSYTTYGGDGILPAPDFNRASVEKLTIGGYAAVDKEFNSSNKLSKGNADTVTAGGAVELAVTRLLGGTNYFRLRVSETTDNLAYANQTNVTGEWLLAWEKASLYTPFNLNPYIGVDMGLEIEPELMAQYDVVGGRSNLLLFNNREESLRLGPQLGLVFFHLKGTGDSTTEPIWSRLTGRIVYHAAYETYSQKYLDWLLTSVTYNLTDSGNIGVTGSYKRGHQEDTGKLDNLFKISLSAKY